VKTEGIVAPKPEASLLIGILNGGGVNEVAAEVDHAGPFSWRKLTHLAEIGRGVQFKVHCKDVQTALRGLLERVFFHWTIVGGQRVMEQPFRPALHDVRNILHDSVIALKRRLCFVLQMSRAQFLSRLGGSKLARYTAAADSVENWPVVKKDAYMKTFVKAEKLNLTAKSDPDPRVIQPRDPRYCYAVGLYIKPIEPVIYKAINKLFGTKTALKGLNADERGQAISKAWFSFTKPAARGFDASRWDQHVSKSLLRLEHSIYIMMNDDAEFARLLKMQLVNRGFVYCEDGRIRYTVDGSRMSGDMNTALGNVLLMCLCMHAYLSTRGFRTTLINDGDDCVVICEEENINRFDDVQTWFLALGIVMKVEDPVYLLEHVDFCQSHPIEIHPGQWRMVRDPRVTLDKDLCVVKPVNNQVDYDFYRNAISQCGLALAGDVPVLYEFYRCLARGTKISSRLEKRLVNRSPETGMDYLALRMRQKYASPSDCCRVSFAKAFDIWPDEQMALEDAYRSMTLKWSVPDLVHKVADLFGTA